MIRTEMYLINTHNFKEVKIRKQAAKDGVQFNFAPFEGVSPSCTPLGNAGESMVVGPERTNQFFPKPHTSFKPSISLFPIGVKKDSLNSPIYKSGDQGLMFCLPNVIPAEPTPLKGLPKGPLPVKKSHEAIPNNFKVFPSSTKELDNRREVKLMLKKLNLNIEWVRATKDFRRVYERLENGTIFPEDRKLKHQAFYLVGYLVKTGCTKRKKGRSEEVINIRVGWEKGKNESEEEKRKVLQKKRRITQEKESKERKLVNLPNEEGVGVVHLLMEKPKERSGDVQDGVPISFLFEGSDMKVEGEEEEKGDAMEIKMNKEFARTTQARRESKGGKLVI